MAITGSRYSILVVLVSLVSIVSTPTLGQERLSERVLTAVGREDAGFFASPMPSEERLRFLLTLVARSARVPIGFEEVAGIPAEAWTNPVHFLHQRFTGFRLPDGTVSDVVSAIYAQFGLQITYGEGGVLGDPPGPDFGLERRMAFDVPSGTVVEALSDVVRAHGGLGWMVHYADAPADIKTSCLRFVTFDGKFSGAGVAACQSTAGRRQKGSTVAYKATAPSNIRLEPTHHRSM